MLFNFIDQERALLVATCLFEENYDIYLGHSDKGYFIEVETIDKEIKNETENNLSKLVNTILTKEAKKDRYLID